MKFIRHMIQSILGQFGFQIVYFGKGRKAPPDPLNAFLIALRGLGFNPSHIVDVGANRGQWTRTVSRHFPQAHYTLVEPQARSQRPAVVCESTAACAPFCVFSNKSTRSLFAGSCLR
jgi:hypothetical protein